MESIASFTSVSCPSPLVLLYLATAFCSPTSMSSNICIGKREFNFAFYLTYHWYLYFRLCTRGKDIFAGQVLYNIKILIRLTLFLMRYAQIPHPICPNTSSISSMKYWNVIGGLTNYSYQKNKVSLLNLILFSSF